MSSFAPTRTKWLGVRTSYPGPLTQADQGSWLYRSDLKLFAYWDGSQWHLIGEIVNRARGVVPTASLWDVDPTNLANATDGDFNTETGIGTRVTPGSDFVGRLIFDLGAVYNVQIGGKLYQQNNLVGGAANYVDIAVSENGITYFQHGPYWSQVTRLWIINSGERTMFGPCFGRCRYIRLTWYLEAAGTGGGAVAEVQALDLGL